MLEPRMSRGKQSGQSLVEYVMLIATIAGMGWILNSKLPPILQRLEKPFKNDYARTYKYGRPDACGYEGDPPECGGSPQNHPRYNEGGGSHMFGRAN